MRLICPYCDHATDAPGVSCVCAMCGADVDIDDAMDALNG